MSRPKLVNIANDMTLVDLPRRLAAVVPTRRRRDPELATSAVTTAPAEHREGLIGAGFTAMRHRNYRLFWIGQVTSLVGTWMQSVSQPWLVLELGGSPIELGAVLAAQFAPSTVLAPIGGVLADRLDKRRTLLVVQVIAMLQAAVLFALAVSGIVEIWHVFVLAAILGTASAIEMPVRQAFAAELVPERDLVNAIALNSTSFNLSRVVGPAIAGLTIAVFGTAINFGVNALSYVAVLAGLVLIDPAQLHRLPVPDRLPSVRASLVEGLRYARRVPTVFWPLVLLGGVATVAMNFQTLLPLYARDALGLGPDGYGALFAAMGVGSVVGSMTLAFSARRRPMLRLVVAGGAVFLGLELILALTTLAPVAFALIAGIGLASILMVNTINVMIQNSVGHELRGRVMSLYVTVFAGTAPIGGLLAGVVAQAWGPGAGFGLGAVLGSIVLVIASWRLSRARLPASRGGPLPA
jgi:MFS family permease